MKRVSLDFGWYFKNGWADGTWHPEIWEGGVTVDLPHDFSLSCAPNEHSPEGVSTGFIDGGAGVYQKTFFAPEDWADKIVSVEIDGAYRLAEVWLNGHRVGQHPNGYMPFYLDLTPYLTVGQENRLTVAVNNSMPCSSRWYSGSGLYRHVDLCVSPRVMLAHWPVYAYTRALKPDGAEIHAEACVQNRNEDARKVEVTFEVIEDDTGNAVKTVSASAMIPAHAQIPVKTDFLLENARLWSAEEPNLYRIRVTLNGNDSDEALFGVRVIEADAQNGLRINGEKVLLKGGCVHHTLGILGANAYRDAEFKRVRAHKELGFNAIRCAHNPPSRDFLEACDRLGIMVIDEAFDMWRMAKKPNDYHLFFDAWWKEDMRLFITRDRTHPCVILWSTGNEVGERNGASGGARLSKELADFVRSLDASRPLMNAIPTTFNGLTDPDMRKMHEDWGRSASSTQNASATFAEREWGNLTREFAAPLDVVGYNYVDSRYERDHETFPERVMCGTETFPKDIDLTWAKVKRMPWVIGDFTWTSMDYLGEAGLGKAQYGPAAPASSMYPWRAANDADLDLCLNRRAQSYFRSVVWGSVETYIAVLSPEKTALEESFSRWGWPDVHPEWTYPGCEGQNARVDVYSAAEEVELFLNGQSAGVRPCGESKRFTARFLLPYAPGTLTAVSRSGGKEISRAEIRTAYAPVGLRVLCDRVSLPADGQSLAYVNIEIVDEFGTRVPFINLSAEVSVSGEATLAAFGSANPVTEEVYTSGKFTSYLGRWQAILRAGTRPGCAVLTVRAQDMKEWEFRLPIE